MKKKAVCSLFLAFALWIGIPSAHAQSPTLKFDPPCPLTRARPGRMGTKEVHVTYNVKSPDARIKQAHKLTLEVGIDDRPGETRSVQFLPKENGVWEAILSPGEQDSWLHLIFQVRDSVTGEVDTNGGNYWDLIFCQDEGQPQLFGVMDQARGYTTGVTFENGIVRPPSLAKAIALLENELKRKDWKDRFRLLSDYWLSKIQRDGATDTAWNQIAREINQFVDEHRTDKDAIYGASEFVVSRAERLPPELVSEVMNLLRTLDPAAAERQECLTAFRRISHRKDPLEKAGEFRDFAKRCPKSNLADEALTQSFRILRDRKDISGAEEVIHQWIDMRPKADAYTGLAALYIESNIKLDQALQLLDKAEELNQDPLLGRAPTMSYLVLTRDAKRNEQLLIYWRSRAYMQQGKPELALPFIEKSGGAAREADEYFLAGEVYEATGHKRQALDAYMASVVEPAPGRTERLERLKQLWIKEGYGTEAELQQRIESLGQDRFEKKHYAPALLDRPSPDFEFTTIKGEKFRSADWSGKTVVLNFWATWCLPCIPELSGFQSLQAKHPELLVAALVIDSREEALEEIIRREKLETLRIAPAGKLGDTLAAEGVPVTYVIDRGRIRVMHIGAMPELVPSMEADLAALKKNSPSTK